MNACYNGYLVIGGRLSRDPVLWLSSQLHADESVVALDISKSPHLLFITLSYLWSIL
jgi:hypothetical protein